MKLSTPNKNDIRLLARLNNGINFNKIDIDDNNYQIEYQSGKWQNKSAFFKNNRYIGSVIDYTGDDDVSGAPSIKDKRQLMRVNGGLDYERIYVNNNPNDYKIRYRAIEYVNEVAEFNNGRYVKSTKPSKPFKFTIDTTLGDGQPTYTQTLVQSADTGNFNYDFTIDWGDGNQDIITTWDDSGLTHTYSSGGTYQISIDGICEAPLFRDELKLISVDKWGYVGIKRGSNMFRAASNLISCNDDDGEWCKDVTSMSLMFYSCANLSILNTTNWNVSNNTSMYYMFSGCHLLSELDLRFWDVSKVTTFASCFNDCGVTSLDLSMWDVSSATSMYYMFGFYYIESKLRTIGDTNHWNTSSLTTTESMFVKCGELREFNGKYWDVSNVTNMFVMFDRCVKLKSFNINEWDVSSVVNMEGLFQECSKIKTINLNNWDVSNVTNMSWVFNKCYNIESIHIDNWDVSSVTTMLRMFTDCYSLTNIDLSDWNVSGVTTMDVMFRNVPLSIESYDNILNGWNSLPTLQQNVVLSANLTKYGCEGKDAHDNLVSTYNWTINDAGLEGAPCD